MPQRQVTFRAPSIDSALKRMRERLGDDAVVVRTAEKKEGGFLGLLTRRMYEVTASPAPPKTETLNTPRRPSAAERKYLAQSNAVRKAAPNRLSEFERLVSAAQQRINAQTQPQIQGNAAIALDKPAPQTAVPPVIQRELREMREMLNVLVAENPGAGLPPELAPSYRLLVDQGLPRSAAAELIAAAMDKDAVVATVPQEVLLHRLGQAIQRRTRVTGGMRVEAGQRKVVALTGPTGVGKTTNLAKLAAISAVREGARVGLITSDTYRVAAPEQLRVYANIIGLPLEVVNDSSEMFTALRKFRDHDLVLIDTAGGSQYNLKQIRELSELLDAAQPDETMLVMAAHTPVDDLRIIAENFSMVKPTSLLFSKLDETRRYGAPYTLSRETDLPLSYFSTGQNVPDDLATATPERVARMILKEGKYRG